MKLLIIRHGDPDYEHDCLTEIGKKQVELLAERLAKQENITKIYCSPLGRAKQTAAPTCEKLGIEPNILDWLQEFPSPRIKTKYYNSTTVPWGLPPQYMMKHSQLYSKRMWKEHSLCVENGIAETYNEICDAFEQFMYDNGFVRRGMFYEMTDVGAENNDTVAFFCHLGLGGALLSHLTGVPLFQWWHSMFLPTSSVTTVIMEKYSSSNMLVTARICSVGDTSHLYV